MQKAAEQAEKMLKVRKEFIEAGVKLELFDSVTRKFISQGPINTIEHGRKTTTGYHSIHYREHTLTFTDTITYLTTASSLPSNP